MVAYDKNKKGNARDKETINISIYLKDLGINLQERFLGIPKAVTKIRNSNISFFKPRNERVSPTNFLANLEDTS